MMEVDRELPLLPPGPEHHSMSTDHEGSSKETVNQTATTATLPPPVLSEAEAETARPDSWENLDEPVLSENE